MEQMYNTQFMFKNKIEYAVVPKEYLKNKNLSLKAKGLLTIIYSLPEDWNYNIKGLVKITGKTEKQITNTIKELENKHYIYKFRSRTKNGKFKWHYMVFVEPTDWSQWGEYY